MARLTLRIPDSLHSQLRARAKREGVSMNQFVMFALSRIATADEIGDQRATFDALLDRFPRGEAEEALRGLLAERE